MTIDTYRLTEQEAAQYDSDDAAILDTLYVGLRYRCGSPQGTGNKTEVTHLDGFTIGVLYGERTMLTSTNAEFTEELGIIADPVQGA